MRSLTLALLLLGCACDGPASPPPAAPPAPAAQPTPDPAPAATPSATSPATPPADGDDNPGFADPKTAAGDAPPPAAPKTDDDPALAAKITRQFGERCKLERSCGDLLGIDCQSAVDGPYYYVQRRDLKTVATCGGACRRGCTDCPPKAWTCPTY
jgi:hypothetical protein